MLTAPIAVRSPGDRAGKPRWEHGLDSGDPLQPLPTVEQPDSGTFQGMVENLFSAQYMAYACVKTYGDAMSSLPLKVYKGDQKTGEREEIREGPLVELLRQPNPNQDYTEFIDALVHSLFIGGEAPIEKVRNVVGSRTVQLLLMRPDRFGPIVNENQGLVGYQYQVGTLGYFYEIDEIMFYKFAHPTNEWRGLSPLTAARLNIETDLAAGRYNKNFMSNQAIPGGTLETDQDLLRRERREIAGEWENVHRGVKKAGKVAVLDKGLRFNGTTLSQRDAQWLEGRQHDAEAICAVFRIPPGVLGIERQTNRSTLAEMVKAWYRGPVRALCRRVEFKMTEQLAKEYGDDLFVEFYMEDILRPEFPDLIDALNKAWWIVPDEKRKYHNYPAIEGGDQMYVPVNMAAGGEPVFEVLPPANGNGNKRPKELMPAEEEDQKVMRPFGR